MKPLLSAGLLLLMATATALASDETATAPKVPPKNSALVQASKNNGGARKKKPRKVITNTDVRKSKGKLVVLPPTPGDATPAEPQPPAKGLLEQQDDRRKARLAAEKRLALAEERVKSLEKELARIEQSYYDESDPSRRDSAIAPRFVQTKRQLDDARKELADARDAYDHAAGERS